MTDDQLKEGQELRALIAATEQALCKLRSMQPDKKDKQAIYDDRSYWLQIIDAESGVNVNLNRYYGNRELKEVIIDVLEKQLADYKAKFAAL